MTRSTARGLPRPTPSGAPERARTRGCRRRSGVAGLALAALTPATVPATAQEIVELPLEDRLLDGDFPEVHRIGDGGRDWELLTRVTSIGFDARGNLHIGDWSSGDLSVLVVDASGELVARFGRRGDGPGEFRRATHALALPDGRTVVVDDGHLAYQLFDAEGGLERWVRYPGLGQGDTPPLFFVRSADPRLRKVDRWNGGLLARVTTARMLTTDTTTTPPQFDLELVPGPRTVLRVSLDGDAAREERVAGAANPGAEGVFFFGALPSGRVAFADTTTHVVGIADPAGRTERLLVRPFPPRVWDARTVRAFKDHQKEIVAAAVAEGRGRAGMVGLLGGLEALQRRIEETEIEGAIPLIEAMETTWEGNIWVLRTPARGFVDINLLEQGMAGWMLEPSGLTAVGPGPIDVITPAGGYLGTIPDARMPNAFGPDGLVAYVTLEEFDVPVVVVRRLPEGMR